MRVDESTGSVEEEEKLVKEQTHCESQLSSHHKTNVLVCLTWFSIQSCSSDHDQIKDLAITHKWMTK